PDQTEKYGTTMDDFGGKIAFKEWADGKGYNLEAFWPWKYVRTSAKALNPGDTFVLGVEAMWGNQDGTKLEHRLVDNLKDDSVNRIFFFRAKDGWGKVVLSDKGNLDVSDYQKALQAARLKKFLNYETVGSMPIEYTLPEDREVTIAIDNEDGHRVRNLFGQFPRSKGKNIDYWDGLDDSGNPVPAGKYTAIIVDHEPFELELVNSVYNTSKTPWVTENGRLTWGSNHGHPTSVESQGDIILLTFTGTEGSSGVIRVDAEGDILWADVTEALDITMDDQYAYLLSRESWTQRCMVRKLDLENGDIVLFENPERSTESALPIEQYSEMRDESSIAYAYGKLYIVSPGQGVWQMNPSDGKVEAELTIPGLIAVENQNQTLWGLFSDGRIATMDKDGNVEHVAFTAKGLDRPARLAISDDGKRFAIRNKGTQQVFVYDAKGKQLFTIGENYDKTFDKVSFNVDSHRHAIASHDAEGKGGMRPAGEFVESNLVDPNGLDFDADGTLWVSEANGTSRRVARWSPDGELLEQYWGSADYGAMSGFPITHDSSRFIVHGIEFKLDPNPDLTNRPTQEQPLYFHPALSHGTRGIVFEHNGHEYAMNTPESKQYGFMIAKRGDDHVFHPVVIVDYDNPRTKDIDESAAWVDKNDNQKVDEGESISGNVKGKNTYWSAGWVNPNLEIITADQYIYRPTGFTETGVPLYDFENPERPETLVTGTSRGDNTRPSPDGAIGTFVMDSEGNISDGMNYATVDGRTGSYPNPYRRHDAPAARRGLLIAPFRTNGVVEDVPGGHIVENLRPRIQGKEISLPFEHFQVDRPGDGGVEDQIGVVDCNQLRRT
ncbi:MAG: FlgD immunoglobulin-like domain containing protein, partial [Puniceicoccales bacterium]